jgi:hypothetical protein
MNEEDVERQFDIAVARAGLTVPPERRPVMLAAFEDVLAWSAMLTAPARAPALEPSNTYSVAGMAGVARAEGGAS